MLVVPAPAKLNLALEVNRRRPDGWHDIDSVVVPIDWHDLIGLDIAARADGVRVTGPASSGVPGAAGAQPAAENLAARAAGALIAAAAIDDDGARITLRGVSVWIHKRVPAAAGLGGGSADAAAVLRAGSRLLHRRAPDVAASDIPSIAAALGSDVPALLARAPVHVTGRGEHLAAVDAPQLHLVVVFLGPSATGDAYGALRQEEMSDGSRVRRLIAALHDACVAGEAPARMSPLSGDLLGSALEAPALRLNEPLSAATIRLRESTHPLRWHMTGSGGAFFAIMRDAAAAAALAERLRAAGLLARACRTLPSSPVRT